MKIAFSFLKNDVGATAIEFALLIPILLTGIFSIMEVGYKAMLQTELDEKLYETALVISINDNPATNATEFMQDTFCQDIKTNFLRCGNVQIGVKTVTSRLYQHKDNSYIGQWDTGCEAATLIVEMAYPVQNIVHPVNVGDIVTIGEDKYYRSRGIVRREPILSGTGSC